MSHDHPPRSSFRSSAPSSLAFQAGHSASLPAPVPIRYQFHDPATATAVNTLAAAAAAPRAAATHLAPDTRDDLLTTSSATPMSARSFGSSVASPWSVTIQQPPADCEPDDLTWTFQPHAAPPQHAIDMLRSSTTKGLSSEEAARRLARWGPNSPAEPSISLRRVCHEGLVQPRTLLLLSVGSLYWLWGTNTESLTAGLIVLLSLTLELVLEYRARRSVQRVSASAFRPLVRVVRDGAFARVSASEVVRGDVVEVVSGTRLPFDARVLVSHALLVDESVLTGDGRPSSKDAAVVLAPGVPVRERSNLLFAGTLVTHGSARAIVTATSDRHPTAARTQMEQMRARALVGSSQRRPRTGRSPLQVSLKSLSLRLTVSTTAACMALITLGFMRGLAYQSVLLMGLALAGACTPAALPAMAKDALGGAARRLRARGVCVTKLKSAEALGAVSTILADKTAVLTRDELDLVRLAMPGRVLRVPRPPPPGSDPATAQPFRASTEDVLAFEPLLAQGWLLSSPTLTTALSPVCHTPGLTSEEALETALRDGLVRDAFDIGFLRFFAQRRRHQLDLNATFLRHLLAEALAAARATQIVHVMPHDPVRRRSSCIRRVPAAVSGGVAAATDTPADSAAGTAAADQLRLCTRGSGEFVLASCTYALHAGGGVVKLTEVSREDLRRQMRDMADSGLRVMGFAVRRLEPADIERVSAAVRTTTMTSTGSSPSPGPPGPPLASLEAHMTFLGIVGFGDTLRDGAVRAVRRLQRAGVQVKLLTGDVERVAAAAARTLGILPPDASTAPNGHHNGHGHASTRGARGGRFAPQPSAYISSSEDESEGSHTATRGRFNDALAPPSSSTTGRARSSSRDCARVEPIPGVWSGALRTTPRVSQRRPSTNRAASESRAHGAAASSSSAAAASSSSSRTRLPMPPPPTPQYDTNAKAFSRMSPQDKLNLVLHLKAANQTVLATGIAASDAPALATVDVGVAMSSHGSDVARETAGVVLARDELGGLVVGVREGRRTLSNLRRALRFSLAFKVALVLLFLATLVSGIDLPLRPLHVIILEALLGVGAAIAFSEEAADPENMSLGPAQWSRDRFLRDHLKRAVLPAALALLIAAGGVLAIAHRMVIVSAPVMDTASFAEMDLLTAHAAAVSASLPGMHSVDEAAQSASNTVSSLTPPAQDASSTSSSSHHHSHGHASHSPSAHSSSSYFPSILAPFEPDSHLQLTQTLVLVAFLLSSVMLVTLLRSRRSLLFACCDRRALRRMRRAMRRRPNGGARATPDPFMETAKATTALNATRGGVPTYDSLAGVESSRLLPADTRVDARDDSDAYESDDDSSSEDDVYPPIVSSSVARSSASPLPHEVEGLISRDSSTRCGDAEEELQHDEDDDSSLLDDICPLLANTTALAWSIATLACAVLLVRVSVVRDALALAPIDQMVVALPGLLAPHATVPATAVLALPIALFLLAELVKYFASWHQNSANANATTRAQQAKRLAHAYTIV